MLLMVAMVFLSSGHVYKNGNFITLWEKQPSASVIITENGKISFVGNTVPEEYKTLPQTDMQGRLILPGLTDAHAHYLGLANAMERIDLRGTPSFQEVVGKTVLKAKVTPDGIWILGRGWDQNLWESTAFPTHHVLTEAVPNHPVCLYRVDGHALILNKKAMEILHINKKTVAPDGGQILLENGLPTGILIDNAMALAVFPEPDRETIKRLLINAGKHLLSLGITGVHDAGVTSNYLRAFEDLGQKGELPIRVYAMLENEPATLKAELSKGLRINLFSGFLTVRCIKMYADGALGSRGAWLKSEYADQPGHTGLQVTSKEDFIKVLALAKKFGFQVATHAIGDRANLFVLNNYFQIQGDDLRNQRYRIEHAQIVDPVDIPLFAKYGVIPSMQTTHCTSDMDWAGLRLGKPRLVGAYAWRTFLDSGCYIPIGSDFPVEKPSPWDGLYSAVTRKHQDGSPTTDFHPQQVLTRMEALKGFTLWAAQASFQENHLGSLSPGKYADFIVIDRDYFSIPEIEIPNIKVLQTYMGGALVFER